MQIETEYNIGDIVYTIDTCAKNEWNKAKHKKEGFLYGVNLIRKHKFNVIIKENKVEGFIIDKNGAIHPAVDGHDGWNKIVTYFSLNDIVYKNLQDAIDDLEKGGNDE